MTEISKSEVKSSTLKYKFFIIEEFELFDREEN